MSSKPIVNSTPKCNTFIKYFLKDPITRKRYTKIPLSIRRFFGGSVYGEDAEFISISIKNNF